MDSSFGREMSRGLGCLILVLVVIVAGLTLLAERGCDYVKDHVEIQVKP